MFAARGRPLRAAAVGCALLILAAACGLLWRRCRRHVLDADVRLTHVSHRHGDEHDDRRNRCIDARVHRCAAATTTWSWW
jgi:hypothetical protein